MGTILFSALSAKRVTGARFAESVLLRALRRKHEVRTFYYDEGLIRLPFSKGLSYPLFGLLPYFLRKNYDLTITSDSFVFADLVYVQPPAGPSVTLPIKDNIFLSNRSDPLGILLESIVDRLVREVATFVANSRYTQRLIRLYLGREAELLYPPVPVHLYDPSRDARKDVVVTIAGISPTKNLKLLPEVCSRVTRAHFILLGFEHPQYHYLVEWLLREIKKRGLQDRFQLLLSASDAIKKEVLERAKVLFHPALFEPFGICIAEGMAAGAIPITHDSGGPQEFVPKELRYRDVEEASQLIGEALVSWSPSKARLMRQSVMRFREERFEEEVLELVERILVERSSRAHPLPLSFERDVKRGATSNIKRSINS